MEGRWVTIRGRHIYVDDKGYLRPGGPEADGRGTLERPRNIKGVGRGWFDWPN